MIQNSVDRAHPRLTKRDHAPQTQLNNLCSKSQIRSKLALVRLTYCLNTRGGDPDVILNTAQNPRVKITFCCLTWFIITQFKDLFNIYDWTNSWAATQEAAGWNFQSSLYILKKIETKLITDLMNSIDG